MGPGRPGKKRHGMFWGLNALQVTQEPGVLKEQVMVTFLSQGTLCMVVILGTE